MPSSDAPKPGAPAPAPPRRTVSNPGALKAVSAARAQPLAAPAPALTGDRLKEGAADTALNVLSIFRELWEDFRSSDRFFKYKAGIIALWLLLSVSGFVVACPSSGESNDIGAHLVIAGEPGQPIFMVKNQSGDAWRDVVLVVNDTYRAAYAEIGPNGDFTLNPKLLMGPDGRPAPAGLRITELEVLTNEGSTRLLRGGAPLE